MLQILFTEMSREDHQDADDCTHKYTNQQQDQDFPEAYKLFENEVTLPLHTKLSDEDVAYVIQVFTETVKEVRGY